MKKDPLEVIFSLEEGKEFFQKKKPLFFQIFLIGACLHLLFSLVTPVQYRIVASFLERKKETGTQDSLKALFFDKASSEEESKVASLMRSRKVMKALIEKKGLQVKEERGGLIKKAFRNLGENLLWAFFTKISEKESFPFREVAFEGETPLFFSLQFFEEKRFFVFSSSGKKLGQGELKVPFFSSNFSFTLSGKPKKALLNKRYTFHLMPWQVVYEGLRADISIKKDKENPKLLSLSLLRRNRKDGVAILNGLMEAYREYVQKQQEEEGEHQVAYLKKRQEEIENTFLKGLREYGGYLEKKIQKKGFLSTKEESIAYTKSYEKQVEELLRLQSVEKELERCKDLGQAQNVLQDLDPEIESVYKEIRELSAEKEGLELSLRLQGAEGETFFLSGQGEKEAYSEELEKVKKQIVSLEEGQIGTYPPVGALALWEKRWQENKGEDFSEWKEEFFSYKEHLISQLKIERAILEKRVSSSEEVSKELEGIDLQTAKELSILYHNRLDNLQEKLKQLSLVKEKLQDTFFEFSSLSTLLQDSVGQEKIRRLSQLATKRKEIAILTEKEKRRLDEDIAFEKKGLLSHIEASSKVEATTLNLVKQKQRMLQCVIADRLDQSLVLLKARGEEFFAKKKKQIERQKKDLLEKISQVKQQIGEIPEQMEKEKILSLQKEVGAKMVQTITELIENKTLSNKLLQVESKPLDEAVLPIKPVSKLFLVKAVLFGGILSFFSFLALFVLALIKGLPVSSRTLKLLNQRFLGEISSQLKEVCLEQVSDKDLETLREMRFFLEEENNAKIVSLLNASGPNYVFALAKLFVQKKEKVLVVNCDLQNPYKKKEEKGLLTALKESELSFDSFPLEKGEGIDYLPSGGSTRFSVEFFTSEFFSSFLNQARQRYDRVFLHSRYELSFLESKTFFSFSDKMLVTLEKEAIEILQPFMDWAYDGERRRLAFLRKELRGYGKA